MSRVGSCCLFMAFVFSCVENEVIAMSLFNETINEFDRLNQLNVTSEVSLGPNLTDATLKNQTGQHNPLNAVNPFGDVFHPIFHFKRISIPLMNLDTDQDFHEPQSEESFTKYEGGHDIINTNEMKSENPYHKSILITKINNNGYKTYDDMSANPMIRFPRPFFRPFLPQFDPMFNILDRMMNRIQPILTHPNILPVVRMRRVNMNTLPEIQNNEGKEEEEVNMNFFVNSEERPKVFTRTVGNLGPKIIENDESENLVNPEDYPDYKTDLWKKYGKKVGAKKISPKSAENKIHIQNEASQNVFDNKNRPCGCKDKVSNKKEEKNIKQYLKENDKEWWNLLFPRGPKINRDHKLDQIAPENKIFDFSNQQNETNDTITDVVEYETLTNEQMGNDTVLEPMNPALKNRRKPTTRDMIVCIVSLSFILTIIILIIKTSEMIFYSYFGSRLVTKKLAGESPRRPLWLLPPRPLFSYPASCFSVPVPPPAFPTGGTK